MISENHAVTLIRQGTPVSANLSVDGESHVNWKLTLTVDGESWSADGWNVFQALHTLRETHLDPLQILICVNGARRNAAVSGMLADMGDGWQVYLLPPARPQWLQWLLWRLQVPVPLPPRAATLDPAPQDLVCSAAEQNAHYRKWRGLPPGTAT